MAQHKGMNTILYMATRYQKLKGICKQGQRQHDQSEHQKCWYPQKHTAIASDKASSPPPRLLSSPTARAVYHHHWHHSSSWSSTHVKCPNLASSANRFLEILVRRLKRIDILYISYIYIAVESIAVLVKTQSARRQSNTIENYMMKNIHLDDDIILMFANYDALPIRSPFTYKYLCAPWTTPILLQNPNIIVFHLHSIGPLGFPTTACQLCGQLDMEPSMAAACNIWLSVMSWG